MIHFNQNFDVFNQNFDSCLLIVQLQTKQKMQTNNKQKENAN